MVNYNRPIAGIFAGVGALILLYKGETTAAVAILSSMIVFFVGEQNGKRTAKAGQTEGQSQ